MQAKRPLHAPEGATCFFDGSYLKIKNNIVFRHDGIEWVRSKKTVKQVERFLKNFQPFFFTNWEVVNHSQFVQFHGNTGRVERTRAMSK